MQLHRSWLALLGAVSLALIPPPVSADAQLQDPNLSVIRQYNIVLTDNTKLYDLSCCMGLDNELPSIGQYQCFAHQDMQMGNAPGSRRMGLQYCEHLPGSTPDDAKNAFKDACTKATGELLTPDQNYCPQIWPNYKDDYKKPPPPAPAAPAPASSPYMQVQEWKKGDRLPTEFRDRQYVIDNWKQYSLPAPRKGTHWVGVGAEYYLVAPNGVIQQVGAGT